MGQIQMARQARADGIAPDLASAQQLARKLLRAGPGDLGRFRQVEPEQPAMA